MSKLSSMRVWTVRGQCLLERRSKGWSSSQTRWPRLSSSAGAGEWPMARPSPRISALQLPICANYMCSCVCSSTQHFVRPHTSLTCTAQPSGRTSISHAALYSAHLHCRCTSSRKLRIDEFFAESNSRPPQAASFAAFTPTHGMLLPHHIRKE